MSKVSHPGSAFLDTNANAPLSYPGKIPYILASDSKSAGTHKYVKVSSIKTNGIYGYDSTIVAQPDDDNNTVTLYYLKEDRTIGHPIHMSGKIPRGAPIIYIPESGAVVHIPPPDHMIFFRIKEYDEKTKITEYRPWPILGGPILAVNVKYRDKGDTYSSSLPLQQEVEKKDEDEDDDDDNDNFRVATENFIELIWFGNNGRGFKITRMIGQPEKNAPFLFVPINMVPVKKPERYRPAPRPRPVPRPRPAAGSTSRPRTKPSTQRKRSVPRPVAGSRPRPRTKPSAQRTRAGAKSVRKVPPGK